MIKQLLPCLFAALMLITGCESDSDPAPSIQKTCKIISIHSTYINSDGSKDTSTITHEYDTQNRLIAINDIRNSSKTESTYNSEDFLTEQRSIKNGQIVNVTSYEYVQGKLHKTTITSKENGQKYRTELVYAMDGYLVSSISQDSITFSDGTLQIYTDTTVYTFTNGKLTGKIQKEGNSTHTTIIETNERGFVTKEIGQDNNSSLNGNKDIYMYDGEGQLIRREHYSNEELTQYDTYEYDDKENAANILYSSPKGHPTFRIYYGFQVHNMTKHAKYFLDLNSKVMEQAYVETYEYEYDTEGYPKQRTGTVLSRGKTTKFTALYTFNCQ
ncbi:hypothetical protein [Xanthocytophaga flava]|uniref:hypothetical protein n=1 Tax=Xanthocytophaga flava TaxID=3048013 RepID=UPI0028D11A37|nr:hypothetical protein [Xanthocytophaga flavus]MDJ1470840.1 hypothetical protein [Xanthocytophaga flavus]